jgi:flavin-dependent dehydrogenase
MLIDKQTRPLVSGAHKVGESSIEAGTHYLMHTLKLRDYLERVHKFKCGLRFFTKKGTVPIDKRTETGSPDFPAIPAMQLDRGVLENDLRQMCVDMDIELLEGALIKDIRLSDNGDYHEIEAQDADRFPLTVRARWVIDATGRRRMLSKKLGLAREVTHKASACWWRLPGKWDITEAVQSPAGATQWRERELGPRWYSTNHFLGNGYWVWVIPVASHTSIGIVADENIHPISQRASIEKARQWMEQHEPHLAAWMKDADPDDFLALKNFAYTSENFYSENRWACVGEAAMFADPYYSTGTDLIALQNNVVTRMILRDKAGTLTKETVRNYEALVAEFYRGILAIYDGQYGVFGTEFVHFHKTMWDYDYITGAMGKLGFAPHVLDEVESLPALTDMMRKWSDLNIRVQKLLRDWAALVPEKAIDRHATIGPQVGDGMLVPNMQVFQTFTDQLKLRCAVDLIRDCEGNLLEFAEQRAIWIFRKAARDVFTRGGVPAALIDKIERQPLNARYLDLNPQLWNSSGLFDPTYIRVTDLSQMDYMVPAMASRDALVKGYQRPHEIVLQNTRDLADKPAVVFGARRISYGELGNMVSSACQQIMKAGGVGQQTVAIPSSPCVEAVAALVAALSAGHAVVGFPDDDDARDRIIDSKATLTLGKMRLPGIESSLGFDELFGHDAMLPQAQAPTVANRIARCFGRYKGCAEYQTLHWISHYSLMNYYLYTELALRERMAFNQSEAAHPTLVVASMTVLGQDWLLPLVFGGTLVIPDPAWSEAELIESLRSLAVERGGQPIISGTPDQLKFVTKMRMTQKDVGLLSIDKILSASEAGQLCKIGKSVVNSGVIESGHENLWPDEIKNELAIF